MNPYRTHVSYDGYLQRVAKVIERQHLIAGPRGEVFVSVARQAESAEFVARGRLVNPNGSYEGAPLVELYKTKSSFVAVLGT